MHLYLVELDCLKYILYWIMIVVRIEYGSI